MKILISAPSYYLQSGGDVIYANLAKAWSKDHNITIITNEGGSAFCLRQGIKEKNIILWRSSYIDKFGVYVEGIYKSLVTMFRSLFFDYNRYDVIFATSYFWPDLAPGIVGKIKNPKAKLIVTSYLFTPTLGIDYSGGNLKGFFLYIIQSVSMYFMKKYADLAFTASSMDKEKFYNNRQLNSNSVMAIRGGVDTNLIKTVPNQKILYDCVFLGRFVPQKNLNDLLDIWKLVLQKDGKKKLALIGAGPEEKKLKDEALAKHLANSITFLGPLDMETKIKALKSARVFVSASLYDSGNIALDEALGCGIPGIIYDLKQLNYPQGVLKIKPGDKNQFVSKIIELLNTHAEYKRLSREALIFARGLDWEYLSKKIILKLNKL